MLLLSLFLFLGAASCYRRNHSTMLDQLQKIQDLTDDSIKLINEDTNEDGEETRKLQVATSNFCLYMEEATSLMHKAAEQIRDPKVKEECNAFIVLGRTSTYSLEKVINAPGKTLKRALKHAMKLYGPVLVDSIKLYSKVDLSNNDMQTLINSARESYDLALFNFFFINTELKHYNDPNKKISDETVAKIDYINGVLNNITTNNAKITKELVIYLHNLSRLADILTLRLERLEGAYKDDDKRGKILRDATLKLSNSVRELRKSEIGDDTTEKHAKSLAKHFEKYLELIKDLTELGDDENNQKPDVVKSVLIEILAISITFGAKLDYLLKPKL